MERKRNLKSLVTSICLCLLLLFNVVLARPTQIVAMTTTATTDQNVGTEGTPETKFKVRTLDGSLIDEQEKHNGVYTATQNDREIEIKGKAFICHIERILSAKENSLVEPIMIIFKKQMEQKN